MLQSNCVNDVSLDISFEGNNIDGYFSLLGNINVILVINTRASSLIKDPMCYIGSTQLSKKNSDYNFLKYSFLIESKYLQSNEN